MVNMVKEGQTEFTVIVADFSILHAGGRSLFRVPETLSSSPQSPRPRPSIIALEEAGQKRHMVAVFNLNFFGKSEIHAGGDNKL
jgi:hypothetical protein